MKKSENRNRAGGKSLGKIYGKEYYSLLSQRSHGKISKSTFARLRVSLAAKSKKR